jgi:hypothetical protein
MRGCHYQRMPPNQSKTFPSPKPFSHLPYEKSKRRLTPGRRPPSRNTSRIDEWSHGIRLLTDPAMHKRNDGRRLAHLGYLGRTDRGEKGMRAFFDSHVCTNACRLFGLVQELQ